MKTPLLLWQEAHSTVGGGKHGTGMTHRAHQVGELLRRTGADIVLVDVNPAEVSKLRGLATGLRRLWSQGLWRPSQLNRVGRFGRRLVAYHRYFDTHSRAACVVWGIPMDWVVPIAAGLHHLPVIAMPNDLDALAPRDWDGVTGRGPYANLKVQAQLIAGSSAVVCISQEEQWLLSCLGANAEWLPYYPDGGLFNDLLQVRAKRRPKVTSPLLMVSAQTNPSNRSGTRHVLNLITSLSPQLRPKIQLVGYGTESLRGEFDTEMAEVAGPVDDDRLFELLAEARALLIYQHSGSGALTRIPEALIAGVPVICNGIAARSAHHYDGVYTFETAGELAELLTRDLPMPPVPPRPVAAEERFIASVRRVMGMSA